MADRKSLKEKSRPFTTVDIPTFVKMSMCGTDEFRDTWKKFFKNKEISKSEFFITNLMKDFGTKNRSELFDDDEIKDYNKRVIKVLLDNLNLAFHEKTKGEVRFNSFQDYWEYILKRENEK